MKDKYDDECFDIREREADRREIEEPREREREERWERIRDQGEVAG